MAQTTVLLRNRAAANAGRVSFVELFYDLVFVFAITQLSHLLLHHYTLLRGGRDGVADARGLVGLDLHHLGAELARSARGAGAADALSLDAARALHVDVDPGGVRRRAASTFALAFVAMQVGRSLFIAWCLAEPCAPGGTFQRIAVWLAASGVFWIVGGLAGGRGAAGALGAWRSASSTSGRGLATGCRGFGRSATADWDVLGEHIAERCGLFVIICLGETLLISGATFAEAEWTADGIAAFVVNFLGTVAMWWLYFHIGQERAARAIEHSDDPGRMARIAFTYAHIPIIAGIVVSAVAAELVIAHPDGHAGVGRDRLDPRRAGALSGRATIWFKTLTSRWTPLSHLVGLGLFGGGLPRPPLAVSRSGSRALAIAILIVVAVWEWLSLGGGLRETTGELRRDLGRAALQHRAGIGERLGDVGAASIAEDLGLRQLPGPGALGAPGTTRRFSLHAGHHRHPLVFEATTIISIGYAPEKVRHARPILATAGTRILMTDQLRPARIRPLCYLGLCA